jgi:hypothetical protein
MDFKRKLLHCNEYINFNIIFFRKNKYPNKETPENIVCMNESPQV